MNQQRANSPVDDPGALSGESFNDSVRQRHDIVGGPCPLLHPVDSACACDWNCYKCSHKFRLGNAQERARYRESVLNDRRLGVLRVLDPPRRVFKVRLIRDNLRKPPSPQWGNLDQLPVELLDEICAISGEFPGGVAGLREDPGNPMAHNQLSLAIGQRPCTERHVPGLGVGGRASNWGRRCPNDRFGAGPGYEGRIHSCQEFKCRQRRNSYRFINTPGSQAWVCEDHFNGAKDWWKLHNRTNLDKSHRVPPCRYHEEQLMRQYPNGINTCTCSNVSFTSWQCRSCFDHKIRKMRRNFQYRVELPFRGDADLSITRPVVLPGENGKVYWSDWKVVRAMLAKVHPCMHEPVGDCTFKRIGGIYRKRVLDCRCCGGVIVQPQKQSAELLEPDFFEGEVGQRTFPWTAVRGTAQAIRKSTRGTGAGSLVELDEQGKARYT